MNRPIFLSASVLASLCAALLSVPAAFGAGCFENRDYYQSLPTVIGKEDQAGKFPFALQCDTVFVRKGVTTVVHPGTMLYFAKPSINSVIKVEGTLILKGTKNSYVTLSGSLDSSRNGPEPGKRQWGGIEVADGGRLEMEHAGFMKAPTPITAFSTKVRIVNSWFKGSSGMILPDGSLYAMESSWHAINNLDLSQGFADRKSESRPEEAISESEKARLFKKDSRAATWKKAGIGVAALAAVGVGVALLLPEEKPSTAGPGPKPTANALPDLPPLPSGAP